MALIPQDLTPYIRQFKSDPASWDALRAASPGKDEIRALLQGLEDWFEANRASAKAAMESNAGLAISAVLAKKIGRVWMAIKFGGE